MPLKRAIGLLKVFESRFLGTLRALRLICFASGRFSKFGVSKLWQLVINPIISEKLIWIGLPNLVTFLNTGCIIWRSFGSLKIHKKCNQYTHAPLIFNHIFIGWLNTYNGHCNSAFCVSVQRKCIIKPALRDSFVIICFADGAFALLIEIVCHLGREKMSVFARSFRWCKLRESIKIMIYVIKIRCQTRSFIRFRRFFFYIVEEKFFLIILKRFGKKNPTCIAK